MERLIDFLINIIGIFQFWVVLDRPEYGWLFRLGKPVKFLRWDDGWFGTGLHLCLPFYLDQVFHEATYEEWSNSHVSSVTLKDGATASLQGTFRYKIRADEPDQLLAFIVEFGNEEEGLPVAFEAAIATTAELYDRGELLDPEGGGMQAILDQARKNLNRYGIKIFEFQWRQKSFGRQFRVIM